jgi:hypothetical protein
MPRARRSRTSRRRSRPRARRATRFAAASASRRACPAQAGRGCRRRHCPRVDSDIDREISQIVGALEESHAPLGRRELAERTNSRYWGAGRFSRALGTAMARGDVRRTGRGHYEKP